MNKGNRRRKKTTTREIFNEISPFSRSYPLEDHCELCPKTCLTCSNSTSCLTCNDQLVLLNNQCVEECPDGYYLSNQECLTCHPICNSCKGKIDRFI